MSQELIYTSVPRGLKPGSKGFCTVAQTAELSSQWAERLESLSGYRPIFPLGDKSASKNPVNWAHWRVNVAGRTRSVLSRVAFAGVDYSQRSNKFAHHLVLEPGELPAAGPAWLMLQPGVLERQWVREPGILPKGRPIPQGDRQRRPCSAWAAASGDAGWAGVLAEAFITDQNKPAYLIIAPGFDALPLIDEAIGLLPAERRWQVTFSTHFTELPAGLTCTWRAVAVETAGAKEALRSAGTAMVIDLTRPLGEADGAFATAARTGADLPEFSKMRYPQNPPAAVDQEAGFLPYELAESPRDGTKRPSRRLAMSDGLELVEEPTDTNEPGFPQTSKTSTAAHGGGVAIWAAVLIGFGCALIGLIVGYLLRPSPRLDDVRSASNIATASPTTPTDNPTRATTTGLPPPVALHDPPTTELSLQRDRPRLPKSTEPNTNRPPGKTNTAPSNSFAGPATTEPAKTPVAGPAASRAPIPATQSGEESGVATAELAKADTRSVREPKLVEVGPLITRTDVRPNGAPWMSIAGFESIDNIRLIFPNGDSTYDLSPGGPRVRAESLSASGADLTLVVHISMTVDRALGPALEDDKLGVLTVKGAQLQFSWILPNDSPENLKLLANLAWELLRRSVVVGSKHGVDRLRLGFQNEHLEMSKSGSQYHYPRMPAGLSDCIVAEFPETVDEGWTHDADSSAGAYKKPWGGGARPQESLRFEVVAKHDSSDAIVDGRTVTAPRFGLEMKWSEKEYLKQMADAQRIADHPELDPTFADLTTRIAAAKNGHVRDDLNNQRNARSQSLTDDAKFANDRLNAFEKLNEIIIRLKLKNGVPLCAVTIARPQLGPRPEEDNRGVFGNRN
jgi:hypothetical protein